VFTRKSPFCGDAGLCAVVPTAIPDAPVTFWRTMLLTAVNSKIPLLSAVLVIPVIPETTPSSALMIDVMFFSF
jgi:hypothetical protein